MNIKGAVFPWRDVAIIAAALLLALILWLLPLSGGEGGFVRIWLDGTLYGEYSIDDDRAVTVEQEDGSINVIRIDSGSVWMESSSCKNQICVHQGTLDVDTARETDNGRFIVCLPNSISVELCP